MAFNINGLSQIKSATSRLEMNSTQISTDSAYSQGIMAKKTDVGDFSEDEEAAAQEQKQMELHKKVKENLKNAKLLEEQRRKRVHDYETMTKKERKAQVQVLLNLL